MPVLIPFTVYFVVILIDLKNEDMLSHTHKLWHNKRPHLQSPMTYMCYKVQHVTFSTSFSAKVLMTQNIRNTNIHSTHSYTPHCVVIMAENLVWWITRVTCWISQISRSQNFLQHWAVQLSSCRPHYWLKIYSIATCSYCLFRGLNHPSSQSYPK